MAGDRARAGIAVHLFVNYVPILAAIPAISRFVGQSLIGGYTPILSGLLRAVIVYVATFAVVYLIACVIDLLAPRFGAQKNFDNALKLTVYSYRRFGSPASSCSSRA